MNNLIVIDSSALISLFSPHDSNHHTAKRISSIFKNRKITAILPGEVFTETVNVLGKKINHEIAIKCGLFILKTDYTIVEADGKIRKIAFDKFQKQPESVSFTDCIVMATADSFETKKIFGFDETFRKNGYIRIGIDDKKIL